jgi:diguanylate cyclase (GGDEF)-like protein
MLRFGVMGWRLISGACLLLSVSAGTAVAAAPIPGDASQLLDRADRIKTASHGEFTGLLEHLKKDSSGLTTTQQWHLRYLDAWEVAYEGKYDSAEPLLRSVIEQSPDDTLRYRATATLINILGIAHRYADAFSQLSQLLDQLPRMSDNEARYQTLAEAAQFLTSAGQYDLATRYAQQLLDDPALQGHACQAMYFKLHAKLRSGNTQGLGPEFPKGIDICLKVGEPLAANAIRGDVADLDIQQGRTREAITLLQRNYADVKSARYPALIAWFDALLAKAYLQTGDTAQAKAFALAAVDDAVKSKYVESISNAYEVLYRAESLQGNTRAALDYHEKYMAADKGYLNDIRARALAYQTVKQQLQANTLQVDALNKRNQILQLQRALDHKAVETSRLYIALLLSVVASVVLWLLRIKRSQLRFKRLATRDSLTLISSRQHFVDATEQALRQAARSTHSACLILLDLDHFKQVNDNHGHVAGDLVLKRAVAACQHHLDREDIFGRLGGEEFAILIPDCTAIQARERAERLRQAIAAAPLWGDTRSVVITASFGVTSTDHSGYELRQLMIDADNALYKAKREGRNRVVYADGDDTSAITPANAQQQTNAVQAAGVPAP